MITKAHRYCGQNYKPGDAYRDDLHAHWCANPIRNYGTIDAAPKSKPKPKAAKRAKQD